MLNKTNKQKALELKKQGLTYQQIADEIGVSKTTVYYWILYSKDNKHDESETPEPVNEQDSIKEVKRELSKLRNQISEIMTNDDNIPNLLELRKLELEHEYRMEELDNNRRENQSKIVIEELQKEYKKLDRNYKESQLILQELNEQNSELQEEIFSLEEKNKKLFKKVTALEEFLDKTAEEVKGISLPELLTDRLRNLFDEYIDYNDEECDLETIELIKDQLMELGLEIKNWISSNGHNYKESDIRLIIERFKSDLEESISNFDEEDSDNLVLEFDNDWITEIQESLDEL